MELAALVRLRESPWTYSGKNFDNIPTTYESHHEKTNNVVFEQVGHKLVCTVTEDG